MAHRFKPDGGLARGDKPHRKNDGNVDSSRQFTRTIDIIKSATAAFGRPFHFLITSIVRESCLNLPTSP